jgi:hypothetical protein
VRTGVGDLEISANALSVMGGREGTGQSDKVIGDACQSRTELKQRVGAVSGTTWVVACVDLRLQAGVAAATHRNMQEIRLLRSWRSAIRIAKLRIL